MRRLHSFSELPSVLLGTLLSCVFFGACFGGGGGHGGGGGGGGGGNNIIDLNVDIVGSGPNVTFTDGKNSSLPITVTNTGKKASDETVTLNVGLPSGVTYVSYASTTPGWTATSSGQTVTCTTSASIAGQGSSTVTITVSVASKGGSGQLTLTVSTADGSPASSTMTKGVIFNSSGGGGSGTASCPPQGNESALAQRSWAFLVQGFNGSSPMAMAANFTPDGTGGITSGAEDINVMGSAPNIDVAIDPSGSSYSVDNSGRGCLALATSLGTKVFHFAMGGFPYDTPTDGAPAGGSIMEYDDTTGSGERALGGIVQAATDAQTGGYVFGLNGWDASGGHVTAAGNVTLDPSGTITGGVGDGDDAGALTSNQQILPGAYSFGTNGRGTISFNLGSVTVEGVLYIAQNAFLVISTSEVDHAHPLLSGSAIYFAAGPLTLQGISGYWVFNSSGASNANIGIISLATTGSLTGTLWQDSAGTTSSQTMSGTFSITDANNGRVTFTMPGLDHPPVAYFVAQGGHVGFLVSTGSDAAGGQVMFQSGTPPSYDDATLNYAAQYGNSQRTSDGLTTRVGIRTFNGDGTLSILYDQSGPEGLSSDISGQASYSVNTDGSGSLVGPMVIWPSGFWFIDTDQLNGLTNIYPSVGSGSKQ